MGLNDITVTTAPSKLVQVWGSSVKNAFAITPADDEDFAQITTALYIGGAGNVKVDLEGVGTAVTFTGLLAGVFYPIRASRVYATGTTATNIIGVY